VPRILQIHKTTILSTVPRFMASEHTFAKGGTLARCSSRREAKAVLPIFFPLPSTFARPHRGRHCQYFSSTRVHDVSNGARPFQLPGVDITFDRCTVNHIRTIRNTSLMTCGSMRMNCVNFQALHIAVNLHCITFVYIFQVIFTEPALSECPEPQIQIKRELDASDRDIIQLEPHPQSVRTRTLLENDPEIVELLSDSDEETMSPRSSSQLIVFIDPSAVLISCHNAGTDSR
jgi:hypothetical protein